MSEVTTCLDLERVLASKCRTRIIRVLAKNGSVNVMELTRKVNSAYNQVNQHLHLLQQEAIVFDKRCGRLRLISLNRENPKTVLLLQAMRILETPTDHGNPAKK